jgi:replicative DNA helicase
VTETKTATPKGAAAVTEPPPSAPIHLDSSGLAGVLDPERALLACLLHLDAVRAAEVAALVRPDDLASPALAELLAAVTALAHLGIDPEPTAVLALLRHDGQANGTRTRAVALVLADLYAGAAVPVSARFYAAAVLEEATRRRAREAGERVAQAAELVPIAGLPELLGRELHAVQALAERSVQAGTR